MDGAFGGSTFGQAGAHGDHGELRTARHLEHVQVAVAVSGIQCLYRHGYEKLARARITDTFTARGVAHTIHLVQRMRDVIREGGLL
jgi:hypothetical protein